MTEIVVAVVLAPAVVVPVCRVAPALWRTAVRWHRAFTWPERLTILVLVGIAIAKAALVAGD